MLATYRRVCGSAAPRPRARSIRDPDHLKRTLGLARGAERVAEVAARFALDALPGRQLALDADVRAGVLDPTAARAARAALSRESQLYGAMDGAMRFVKGDAIAAIVIVVINLVGGLAIGGGVRGMAVGDAARTYSILSIGEGLVAQIPSLVLAVASGLLVTRVAASGGDLGERHGGALLGQPRALVGAGVAMLLLALVPGLPLVPFLVLAVLVLGLAVVIARHAPARADATVTADLIVDAGAELVARGAIIEATVRAVLERAGVPVPTLAVVAGTDLGPRELRVRHRGHPLAWRTADAATDTAVTSAVDAAVAPIAHAILSVDDVAALVARTATTQPVLVREVVPRLLALPPLAALCRELVREGVPIVDLGSVMAAVASAPASALAEPARLLEHVRAACQGPITGRYAPRGELEVYTVDAMIEDAVRDAIDRRGGQPVLAMGPALARDIVGAVRRQVGDGAAVVLTSGDVRRHLRSLLEDELPRVAVLAPHELGRGVTVRNAGRIEA